MTCPACTSASNVIVRNIKIVGYGAGNCALEEIAMIIRTRGQALGMTHGLNVREITRTSRLVSMTTEAVVNVMMELRGRSTAYLAPVCTLSNVISKSFAESRERESQSGLSPTNFVQGEPKWFDASLSRWRSASRSSRSQVRPISSSSRRT